MISRILRMNGRRTWSKLALLFLGMILIGGCSFGSSPSYRVNHYTLEYPPPVLKEPSAINELLRVERFSVCQTYNTSAMIYKEGPHLRNVDPYNRWRTKPGEMATENLVRDLRNSGLFRGVISYSDSGDARYLLEGQVDEFLELNEKNSLALLSLNVTLVDLKKSNVAERMIFQRDYKVAESCTERTPAGLAQGMSRAMREISRQILVDLQKELRSR